MLELVYQKGGYFKNFKNRKLIFTKPIKKLFLDSFTNCIIILNEKCYTTVEMLRCNNCTVIFKKQCYNLQIDICYNIDIQINKKYKDLIYIYNTSCIDIVLSANKIKLPLKWSMFQEQYSNSYYKSEHIVKKTY